MALNSGPLENFDQVQFERVDIRDGPVIYSGQSCRVTLGGQTSPC